MRKISLSRVATQRVFIFDRNELLTLLTLNFFLCFFCFTLGLHYGTRVGSGSLHSQASHGETPYELKGSREKVPDPQPLIENEKEMTEKLEEILHQELRDEVNRSGLSLDHPKDLELPSVKKGAHPTQGADRKPPAHPEADHGK